MPAELVNRAAESAAAIAAAAAACATLFLILWRRALGAVRAAEGRAREAQKALSDLKAGPQQHELRVDRFELLWYPILTAYMAAQEITAASAGLPHCRACVQPLSLKAQGWICPGCAKVYPESLADVQVTDAVIQEAVKLFRERRKGWKVSLKKS